MHSFQKLIAVSIPVIPSPYGNKDIEISCESAAAE